MNTHEFSLRQLLLILKLIKLGNYIKFDSHFVFRETPDEEAFKALKGFLLKLDLKKRTHILLQEMVSFEAQYRKAVCDKTKEELLKDIIAKRTQRLTEELQALKSKTSEDIKPTPAQLDQITQQIPDPSEAEILEASQRRFINSYTWAAICKHAFQNATILDKFDLRVLAAWRVFLIQLKHVHQALEANPLKASGSLLTLNPQHVHKVFEQFVNQLYHIGQHRAAEAIHTYLHYAYLALQHFEPVPEVLLSNPLKEKAKSNGMDARYLGLIMSGALMDGLELVGKLLEKDSDNPVLSEGNEYRFFGTLIQMLLEQKAPFFSKPFQKELCKSGQKQEKFGVESLALQRLLWEDFSKIDAYLNEVHMKASDSLGSLDFGALTLGDVGDPHDEQSLNSDDEEEKVKTSRLDSIPLLNLFSPRSRSNTSAAEESPHKRAGVKKSSPKEADKKVSARTSASGAPAGSPKERSALAARQDASRSKGQNSPGRTVEEKRVTFTRASSVPHFPRSSAMQVLHPGLEGVLTTLPVVVSSSDQSSHDPRTPPVTYQLALVVQQQQQSSSSPATRAVGFEPQSGQRQDDRARGDSARSAKP